MSGGLSRQSVIRCILAWMLLSVLAGCSALFAPKPPPVTEQPAPPPEPEPETPPEAASEASAPAPETPPAHAEAPEAHKPPLRPAHRRPPQPPAPPPETPPPPAPVTPTPIVSTRLLSSNDTRSLLDARVQRPDGKVIGRAIDMFVDKEGKPMAMLVNLSGFLGIGDRKLRFPWSAFAFNATPKKAAITLDVPHGQPPAAEALKKKGPASWSAAHDDSSLLRLIDATVERGDGSRVGRVTDVLIDNHAAPQAAVLDVGSLIHQRRRIAADWSALHFVHRNKDDGLIAEMDLSDAQVDAAPTYEPDKLVRAVSPAPPPSAKPAAATAASSR